MKYPKFEDLPFNARPDLTPYLLHLTKNSESSSGRSAYINLVSIPKLGKIRGSNSKEGFIQGNRKAACFMDVPFASLKYVLTPENTDPQQPRYEPYGIAVRKNSAYDEGCRPVLYLSKREAQDLRIPQDELWRVVRFEATEDGWISWLHEREWRCPDYFKLPSTIQAAFVRTPLEAQRLSKAIHDKPKAFSCRPRSIIPLSVVCQGLLKA